MEKSKMLRKMKEQVSRRLLRVVPVLLIALAALSVAQAGGMKVEGVQPFALSQPRVPALLRPADGGEPLTGKSAFRNQPAFAFPCFMDTGASRMMLSVSARKMLDVRATGETVTDWGIGGTEEFGVSAPYRLCVAGSGANTSRAEDFRHCMPCVLQLRQKPPNMKGAMPGEMSEMLGDTVGKLGISPGEMMQMFSPQMNIVGSPFLKHHVAVMDPRPLKRMYGALNRMMGGMGGRNGDSQGPAGRLDSLFRLLEQSGVGGGTGPIDVDIMRADESYNAPALSVPLRMRDMEEGPLPVTQAKVPFVPGAALQNGNRTRRLDLLLDTGGAVSLISRKVARELGVKLEQPRFTAPVLGVGGEGPMELEGYWLDRLVVPTRGDGALVFEKVPFFVVDIDRLEGTLGLNLLLPSAYMDMDMEKMQKNPMGMLGSLKSGPMPFKRIVIDLPRRRLGLDPAK
ncbi:MAG: retropepsin-like aspartic protease [Planctomycetota bacterium]